MGYFVVFVGILLAFCCGGIIFAEEDAFFKELAPPSLRQVNVVSIVGYVCDELRYMMQW